MAKTENIYTRVDPEIQNQEKLILEQLGIPMSNTIGIFLRQVIMHNGLPFDMTFPVSKPVTIGSLTKKTFGRWVAKRLWWYWKSQSLFLRCCWHGNEEKKRNMNFQIELTYQTNYGLDEFYGYIAFTSAFAWCCREYISLDHRCYSITWQYATQKRFTERWALKKSQFEKTFCEDIHHILSGWRSEFHSAYIRIIYSGRDVRYQLSESNLP